MIEPSRDPARNDLVGLPATAPKLVATRMQADGFDEYMLSEAIGVAPRVIRDVLDALEAPADFAGRSNVAVRKKDRERILAYIAFGADMGEGV